MSFTVGGSTPQLTFADATVQNTAALPLTGGSVSADITVNGLTVGRGGGSVSTNTAVGASALNTNTTSGQSVAVGYQALYTSNYTSGNANNTAVGYNAGYATTTGVQNTFIGQSSGTSNTTGGQNSFLGYGSGVNSTTGSSNTAIGFQSLVSNTTASNNTAVGYLAGYSNTTGVNNVFIGFQAGYTSNAPGTSVNLGYNTCVGPYAGYGLTTGVANCFIGSSTVSGPSSYGAGYYVTTGSYNTILGGYNGNQGGLDIRTASNYIVLSDGAGNPRGYWDANGNFLTKSAGSAGSYNSFQTQNGAGTALFTVRDDGRIATGGAASPYNNTSASVANMYVDSNGIFYRGGVSALKYKTNVRDLPSIDISKFRPVVYNSLCEIDNKQQDYFGFIADEVDSAGYKELVIYGEQGEVEGFQYERMTAVLLKAVQELKAEFDAYKATHP